MSERARESASNDGPAPSRSRLQPVVELGNTVIRPGDDGENTELEVWVGDAWVLGSVELSVQGKAIPYVFPEAYPSTLGTAWDWSLVKFAAKELATGKSMAILKISDAAGNKVMTSFELMVDATRPTVSISAPAPGAVVTGAFEVKASAQDAEPGTTWIELRTGGGSPVLLQGPEAETVLHSEDYPSGELTIEVIARDAAGNRSDPVEVTVTVP